jgi:DNA repair protein RadC
MVSSSAADHRHVAASAAAETARQRSVLAALIASVAPADGERLAAALLADFKTIARVWAQPRESLARILGADSPVTELLLNAYEAAIASFAGEFAGLRIDPFNPSLRQYLITSMGGLSDERLRVLFLDGRQRLIADEELQHGTLAQLAIYPRTIFGRALDLNAAGIILVHNHPSGNVSPSPEDLYATRMIEQLGAALDVRLLDHIIVTASCTHHILNGDKASPKLRGSAFTLRSPARGSTDELMADALQNAQTVSRRRLLRQQLLGAPELFGDPAWEMLVDLFIHHCEGKDLSITALCVPVKLPLSSALRLVQKLADAGIVQRIRDPIDGRRTIVRLEPAIVHRLRAYFAAGAE